MPSSRVRRAQHPAARVYQRLRSAHLERARTHTPATILFVEQSYDFAPELADGLDLVQAGTLRAPAVALASRLRTLEVNEPLVRLRLVRTVLTVLAAQLAGALHREPVTVVTHAIENRDPFQPVGPSTTRARGRRWLDRRLSRFLARRVDRISFGTEAAHELYRDTLGRQLARAETAEFLELPAPCTCPTDPDRSTVTFLGAFDERKGVRELLAAWPVVRQEEAGLRLRLMGKGPLTEEVRAAADQLPGVELVVDPSRETIHQNLRRTRVLVLLSQPRPRWREQVGLPIVEALAHGCTVVTTEQTGLASWLRAHGHVVVASDAGPEQTAQAILTAVRTDAGPAAVVGELPAVDGRTAADHWLFSPGTGSANQKV